MRMMKVLMLLLAMIVVQACSTRYVVQRDLTAYPFIHRAFDYQTAWKTIPSSEGVLIEGLLKNVRYAYINDLELRVSLLGPDGKTRSRASVLPVPQFSRQDDVVPFELTLPKAALNPGDALQFMIRYRGSDGGGDGNNDIDWRSTFTVDALSGAEVNRETN